jgi:hypothetical protein
MIVAKQIMAFTVFVPICVHENLFSAFLKKYIQGPYIVFGPDIKLEYNLKDEGNLVAEIPFGYVLMILSYFISILCDYSLFLFLISSTFVWHNSWNGIKHCHLIDVV